MEYIYLDWNVIQYMKHEIKTKSFDGQAFRHLVNRISKEYRFPFSEGHLKDLAVGYKPQNRDVILEDLKFLNEISGGFVLGIGPKETLMTLKHNDIKAFFEEIINETDSEPVFDVIGDTYQVDMDSLPENDLFRPFLENNKGQFDPSLMQSFLKNLWQLRDDPDYYKKFRNSVGEFKKRFGITETVLDKNSAYFKKIIPWLDFLTIDDEDLIESKFDEAFKAFLSINDRKIDDMTVGEKIETAYGVLDFHPRFRDKVDKKNRPSNIGRDCKNLFFASQAKYYVTEDGATLKKAAFVSKYLSLNVKVENMSKFSSRFY